MQKRQMDHATGLIGILGKTKSGVIGDRTRFLRIIARVLRHGRSKRPEPVRETAAESTPQPHRTKILDTLAAATKSRRRLARYKDASRSLRLAERERCPRAGARHLRTRAASAKRPAGTMTGLPRVGWTGTGGGG